MANNYTQFSFEITDLNATELEWLRDVLSTVDDGEVPADSFLVDLLPDPDYVGFNWECNDAKPSNGADAPAYLIIYAEESGMPENAASFVQEFLSRFRPNGWIGFEWANTCSAPKVDEFGGGAVFVTAGEQKWMSSSQWLGEQMKAHEEA